MAQFRILTARFHWTQQIKTQIFHQKTFGLFASKSKLKRPIRKPNKRTCVKLQPILQMPHQKHSRCEIMQPTRACIWPSETRRMIHFNFVPIVYKRTLFKMNRVGKLQHNVPTVHSLSRRVFDFNTAWLECMFVVHYVFAKKLYFNQLPA